MSFYDLILAKKLSESGGGGGDDTRTDFKALVNRSITEVTAKMLDGLTSIGDYAFYYCPRLTSVRTSYGLTSIGHYAFASCSRLTSVTIHYNVTSIGHHAFASCSSLTSVTMESNIPPTLTMPVFESTPSSLVIYVPPQSVETYRTASGWLSYEDKIQPQA